MRKLLLSGLVLVVAVVVLVVFGQRQASDPQHELVESNVITIGAVLPLTGNASVIGEYIKNGIDLAVDDINQGGGIAGKSIEIQFEDSKNDPKTGVSAFNKLLADPSIVANITAMSGVSNAVIPIADARKKVVVATTASVEGLPEQSEYVFRVFVTAGLDAPVMARFAAERLGLKRVAIIHVSDDFGKSFAREFTKAFASGEREIVAQESFSKKDVDFKGIMAKIRAAKPDGVYLLAYGNNLGILPLQMREAGIDATILSIGTLAQPNVIEQAGTAVEGAYFTTTEFSPDDPANEKAARFSQAYLEAYGKKANYFSAFAYDVVGLLGNAISRGGVDADAIKRALLDTRRYKGVMGEINITKTGDAEFNMLVKQIRDGKVVDPE